MGSSAADRYSMGPGVSIHRLVISAPNPRVVLGKPRLHVSASAFTELGRFPLVQELSRTFKADFIGIRHYYFVPRAGIALVETVSATPIR